MLEFLKKHKSVILYIIFGGLTTVVDWSVSFLLYYFWGDAIDARKAAKKEKNFAEADRIRDELAARGVTLIDTPQGTTYKIN